MLRSMLLSLPIILCYITHGSVLWSESVSAQSEMFRGAYLGQKLPGRKPESFAPELFSLWNDYGFHLRSSVYFSPDGRNLFFTDEMHPVVIGRSTSVWQMRHINDHWSEPQKASFSGDYSDRGALYSCDGKTVYFVSTRPISNKGAPKDYDIWFTQRAADYWAEPRRFDYPVNSTDDDILGGMDRRGAVFLSSDRPGGMGGFDAYRVDYSSGRYGEPENLGLCINTKAQEHVVCVAPDATFLIIYRVDTDNEADAGLYITFRDTDGTWTDAKSMGDHINIHNATCASLSSDNQYFFFHSQGEGIYWMKAEVIDYLRVEDLRISDILHKTYVQKGLDAALVQYDELKKKHADYITIDEYLLNQRGYQLLDAHRVTEAIVLFRINAAIFPASWNAYDSLGEAYLEAHETELAIQSYRRSLELNPENNNAYEVLRKLDALPER